MRRLPTKLIDVAAVAVLAAITLAWLVTLAYAAASLLDLLR